MDSFEIAPTKSTLDQLSIVADHPTREQGKEAVVWKVFTYRPRWQRAWSRHQVQLDLKSSLSSSLSLVKPDYHLEIIIIVNVMINIALHNHPNVYSSQLCKPSNPDGGSRDQQVSPCSQGVHKVMTMWMLMIAVYMMMRMMMMQRIMMMCRALGRKGAHLPFRASKLTQVLRDSFIGDKVIIILILIFIIFIFSITNRNMAWHGMEKDKERSSGGKKLHSSQSLSSIITATHHLQLSGANVYDRNDQPQHVVVRAHLEHPPLRRQGEGVERRKEWQGTGAKIHSDHLDHDLLRGR